MGALRGLPLKEAAAAPTNCSRQNGLGDWAKKPIRTLSKGMAQTVQLLGTLVHEPQPDRPRRALFRARRDQPGQARAPHPQPRGGRRDHHLLDPCHRPCRAAVRADRDHRRRARSPSKGRVDEARGGFGRSSACAPAKATGRGARRFPHGAQTSGGEWIFELPETRARAPAQGADRRRRGHRDAGDRAARPARGLRRHRRRRRRRGRWKREEAAPMSELIRAAFVIARRDFTATVLSRTFLLFLLGPFFPVLMVVVFGGRDGADRQRCGTADGRGRSRPGAEYQASSSQARDRAAGRARRARRWSTSSMSSRPADPQQGGASLLRASRVCRRRSKAASAIRRLTGIDAARQSGTAKQIGCSSPRRGACAGTEPRSGADRRSCRPARRPGAVRRRPGADRARAASPCCSS